MDKVLPDRLGRELGPHGLSTFPPVFAPTNAENSQISSLSFAASLTTSSGYPISHPLVWSLALLCAITLPLFAGIEKKAAEPILPLSLLTRLQPSLVLMGFVLTTATNFSRVSVVI